MEGMGSRGEEKGSVLLPQDLPILHGCAALRTQQLPPGKLSFGPYPKYLSLLLSRALGCWECVMAA